MGQGWGSGAAAVAHELHFDQRLQEAGGDWAEFSKDAEGGGMWALEQALGKPQPDEEAK